jgi:hypothetical protein
MEANISCPTEPLRTLFGHPDEYFKCYQFDESKVPPIILLYGVPFFFIVMFVEWIIGDVFQKKG